MNEKRNEITVLAQSSPHFSQDTMFFKTLEAILMQYRITRFVVEKGSGVAAMAQHWCKLHQVKLIVVLPEPSVTPIDDRMRRYKQMAEELPDMVLVFDIFDTIHDFDVALAESISAKINLVFTRGQQIRFETWEDGQPLPDPRTMVDSERSLEATRRAVNRAKPKRKKTPEEVKAAAAEVKARWREKKKIERKIKKPMQPNAIKPRSKANQKTIRRTA